MLVNARPTKNVAGRKTDVQDCQWIQRLHTYVSRPTRRVINRVSDALRIAAMSLERSQSALGAFHRRMKARLGAAEVITATAHKLARLVYRLLKHGEAYLQQGIEDYEKKFQERKLSGLKKAAAAMGFQLLELQPVVAPVS